MEESRRQRWITLCLLENKYLRLGVRENIYPARYITLPMMELNINQGLDNTGPVHTLESYTDYLKNSVSPMAVMVHRLFYLENSALSLSQKK